MQATLFTAAQAQLILRYEVLFRFLVANRINIGSRTGS